MFLRKLKITALWLPGSFQFDGSWWNYNLGSHPHTSTWSSFLVGMLTHLSCFITDFFFCSLHFYCGIFFFHWLEERTIFSTFIISSFFFFETSVNYMQFFLPVSSKENVEGPLLCFLTILSLSPSFFLIGKDCYEGSDSNASSLWMKRWRAAQISPPTFP